MGLSMGIKFLMSKCFGKFYHPLLHSWQHRKEYRTLRPFQKVSASRLRSMKVKLPRFTKEISLVAKTAIQIHFFYTDLLADFYSHLKEITVPYDLYISTDTMEKKEEIENFFCTNKVNAGKIKIDVFANKGRDIYPFLSQMHKIVNDYEYVAHFHTKKSLQGSVGTVWREWLLGKLLGDGRRFNDIIFFLSNHKDMGLVIPPVLNWHKRGYIENKVDTWYQKNVGEELRKIGCGIENFKLTDYEYSAGTMFVACVKAVQQVFDYGFSEKDFPEEKGQLNHTLQHVMEFIWHPVCDFNGYRVGVVA